MRCESTPSNGESRPALHETGSRRGPVPFVEDGAELLREPLLQAANDGAREIESRFLSPPVSRVCTWTCPPKVFSPEQGIYYIYIYVYVPWLKAIISHSQSTCGSFITTPHGGPLPCTRNAILRFPYRHHRRLRLQMPPPRNQKF